VKDCAEQEITVSRKDKYSYDCETINKSKKSSQKNRCYLRFKEKNKINSTLSILIKENHIIIKSCGLRVISMYL
jgi:hypothetical protein